jgi:hypothetical protein
MKSDIRITILSGDACVSAGGVDYHLKQGEKVILPEGRRFTVLGGMSREPVVFDVTYIIAQQPAEENPHPHPAGLISRLLALL